MNAIFIIGIIIIVGFIFGEIATRLRFPKVTGYIIAGVVLNPGFFRLIPADFTQHTYVVTNISLAFITFSVGGTLLFSRIKRLGKSILSITVCEAEGAFVVVAAGFLCITPFLIHIDGASWFLTYIPVSLLIACLASPTDPSATLAVVHEYKAKGNVSSTIMGVAALDDVLGIINFSIAVVIAEVFIRHTSLGSGDFLLKPLSTIGGAILLGIVFGAAFNGVFSFIKKETEGVFIVLILGLLSLCFGLATLLGVDELLTTMTMGIVVVNFNSQQEKIFKILERYTEELIFVLFFTISGMQLNFGVLASSFMLVLSFFIFRAFGKVAGTMIGASFAKASPRVKKYTAGGLIPQGGIVVGLALIMKQNPAFDNISDIIISVIIGSTVIHELIGPMIAKIVLQKSGEIKN